jgi:enoyl-CoA hydratase/carnithine racemase
MSYEHLRIEDVDGVRILTMDRPERLNALNRRLGSELADAFRAADEDSAVGCVVLTGAGDKAFSAGGDIHEQRELDDTETPESRDAHRTAAARERFAIGTTRTPTIGMINGLAFGGAAALAASLDIRLGCEHARFRFLAVTYGRVNGTWTLPNQIGLPKAKELLFTGREVAAVEAAAIGLLDHLVPCADLRSATLDLATTIAANDRAAVRTVKALLLDGVGASVEAQWSNEVAQAGATPPTAAAEAFARFFDRPRDEAT